MSWLAPGGGGPGCPIFAKVWRILLLICLESPWRHTRCTTFYYWRCNTEIVYFQTHQYRCIAFVSNRRYILCVIGVLSSISSDTCILIYEHTCIPVLSNTFILSLGQYLHPHFIIILTPSIESCLFISWGENVYIRWYIISKKFQ